jgi:hypothetical protein
MIVLQETVLAQDFKIIPRTYAADSMIITNEMTGTSTTYAITATQSTYYLTFSKAVTLKENNFYQLTVKNGSDIVYKDRIFCTNQTVSDYTVNNNEYEDYSSDNDYLTYE